MSYIPVRLDTVPINYRKEYSSMPNRVGDLYNDSPFLTNADDRLMSRKVAAAYIGRSPGTLAVDDCTKRHDFQPIKIGGRVYYRKSVLDAWLSAQMQP